VNRLPISKETVFSACALLPVAGVSRQSVMQVDVFADDGRQAAIEFQRMRILDDAGNATWSWEAVTCWEICDAS